MESKPVNYSKVYDTGTTEDIELLSFFDKDHGIAIANPSIGKGIISRTADGAKTWTATYCPEIGNIDYVKLFSSGIAYLNCDTIIFKSIDSGANWQKIKSGIIKRINFTSDLIGYAISDYHTIIKTEDGGMTWREIFHAYNSIQIQNLLDLSCPDNNTIYVNYWTGSKYLISKSLDGGNTWIHIPEFTSGFFDEINFYSSTSGFIRISNTMLKTSDGGLTWNDANFTSENASVYKIYMANELVGAAITTSSYLTVTNDGGESWRTPFLEERTKDMGFSINPITIASFPDKSFYVGCREGKVAVFDHYNLGE